MNSTEAIRPRRSCIRIANTPHELSRAFSLVYESYLAADLMEPNAIKLRILPQHLEATTDVVVAKIGSEIYGTASLIGDSVLGLPLEAAYGREVESRRRMKITLAEVSCLADRRGVTSRELVHDLMAFIIQRAAYLRIDQMLIAVHPRHVKFYCRFLGFEVFAGLRSYHKVCGNPAIGLFLDLANFERRAPRAFQRVFGRTHLREHLAARPMSRESRRYIERMLGALTKCDTDRRQAMSLVS